MHEGSTTYLVFPKLSLVRILSLDNSQRKNWTIGGMINFQTAGIKRGVTPLKFTILYMEWEEYRPED
jgi:hypothetical protein